MDWSDSCLDALGTRIFDFIGAEFFYEDCHRLFLSRRWYAFAWPVFIQKVLLTARTLFKLADDEERLKQRLSGATVINISLHNAKATKEGLHTPVRRALFQLGAVLRRSRDSSVAGKVKPLNLRIHTEKTSLLACYLVPYCSVQNLTSLELDLVEFPGPIAQSEHEHLCKWINLLLPSLKRLRCRMGLMCECLLDPPKDGTRVNLEELIINLIHPVSLPGAAIEGGYNAYRKPAWCRWSANRRTMVVTKEFIIDAAAAFAKHMPNPRMVRVIDLVAADCRPYAVDVLKRRHTCFLFT
ncbi:hypothetical protein N0V88_006758 [Collariella sp. IMI 366227]|nr:hypothetical protein N0V88_006758 [Collariella sp. IMI 366227]